MQTSGAEAGEEVSVGRPELPAATARKRPCFTASATAALVIGLKRPPKERLATAFPMRPLDLASLTAWVVLAVACCHVFDVETHQSMPALKVEGKRG